MTLLACIAKDAKIEPAVCVAEQVDERCFCPKAPIAISEVSTGTPDPRLKHQLPVLRARAEAMYRKPPEQRYAGPALRVHNKEVADALAPVVEPEAIPATGNDTAKSGTAPAVEPVSTVPEVPSGTEPIVCKICGKELRSDNRSGLCAQHTLEARSLKGSRRLGVPRIVFPSSTLPHVAKPKETVVPIKPVEAHPLAQVIDSPVKVGDPVDAGTPLPDVKALPHAYLVACVQEARRRLQELDPLFVFTSIAKEA